MTPLVSCLLVTADRPRLLRRAVRSFLRQSHPERELVVLDNGQHAIKAELSDVPAEQLQYERVPREDDHVIGSLRNRTLELARGEYVVPQWDDDDWSHPERLEKQVAVLEEGFDSCMLSGTLMHVDAPAYFNNPFIGLLKNGVPPTIMHRRDDLVRYPALRRTSDTVYSDVWRTRRYYQFPRDASYLHLRYFHGGNLWEQEHFLRRMRNTPLDLLLYGWYRYVRRDVLMHPRFRLDETGKQAFQEYLADSRAVGLFEHVKA